MHRFCLPLADGVPLHTTNNTEARKRKNFATCYDPCPCAKGNFTRIRLALALARPHLFVRVTDRSISPRRGVNSISSGSLHVRPMWALSTCGKPKEIMIKIKKDTHPKNVTGAALFAIIYMCMSRSRS